ncbi:flocculation protein FLO11-like [Impatiens glandulifera]|uniref:flocculation protein FLO11-like n=1 Tax=Impatiens glandulifera TaxID=253017 RepID=UPI001FB150B7|nr:flocculation protein FLO11-like [Impatiens glandulifera]
MEPEPVSKTSIEPPPSPPPQPPTPPSPPPQPPPPSLSTQSEAAAKAPVSEGRRNLSFSWSSTSSTTSSFNSLVDSFKKEDINIHDEPQPQQQQQQPQPTTPRKLSLGGASSSSSLSGRFGIYDPNRIPSAIFAKPSNQADWSVASNESLFSIAGNNSFSLGDFTLPNYEPINNNPQAATAPEAAPETMESNNPFGLPVTAEEEFEVEEFGRKSSSIWEDFHEINVPPPSPPLPAAITQPPEIMMTEKEETPPPTVVPDRILFPESCSNNSHHQQSYSVGSSRMSQESGNSCNSFAFPLLTSEGSTNDHLSQPPPVSMGTENERLPPPQPSPKRESVENANSGPQTTTKWDSNEDLSQPEKNSSWFSYFCCCSMNCDCCGRANCLSKGHNHNHTNDNLDT